MGTAGGVGATRHASDAVPADEAQPSTRSRWLGKLSGGISRNGDVALAVGVGAVALLPRLVTVGGGFITTDEPLWTGRSVRFFDAIASGSFGDASARDPDMAVTMPGVVTMWLGTIARGIWSLGGGLNLWAAEGSFASSKVGLDIAQGVVATVTSALIGLLVILLMRWVGRVPALVAGVLVATEPMVVAHGAVLHTDELYTLFSLNAVIVFALLLGIPRHTRWTDRPWAGVVAGLLFAAASLTKLSVTMFLPGLLVLALWALHTRGARLGDSSTWWPSTESLRRPIVYMAAAATALVVVTYPAIWANPITEIDNLWRSLRLGMLNHEQFFLGEPTDTPGPLYYFVALPLRVTPWFLVVGVASIVASVWHRSTRPFALVVFALAGPCLLLLAAARKQFDRYGLPLLVAVAILVGLGISLAWSALVAKRSALPATAKSSAVLAIAGLILHSVLVSPWGLAYFNPALGGSSTARDALLIGWGEGYDQANEQILEHSTEECGAIKVWPADMSVIAGYWPCLMPAGLPEDAAYLIRYVSEDQRRRLWPAEMEQTVAGREVVGEVEIRGLTYATIYAPKEPSHISLG